MLKPSLRILRHSLALLLTTAALAACSHSDEPLIPGGSTGADEVREARLTITIPAISTEDAAASRAPGHGDDRYDTGAGYENFIDLEGADFAFYFFDSNNRYITDLQVTSLLPEGADATSKTYTLLGRMQGDVVGRPLKVVALANWGHNYPENPSTIDDLTQALYDFNADRMALSASNTIPLFGVTNLMTLHFNSLDLAELGTIHMLRAFAKVQVYVSANTADDIEYVELTRYNTRGYCAPAGVYLESDYVHGGDYDADYVNTPHVPENAVSTTPLRFLAAADGSFVAYVPEFDILNTQAADRPRMNIKFSNSSEIGILEFKYYHSPNEPVFDLLRNYWYVYEVERNHYDVGLKVTVQVVPYAAIDLKPDFGLVIGAGYVPIYNDLGIIIYYYSNETGKYYLDPFGKVEAQAPDPGFQRDPIRGWLIVRDDQGRFLYYFDEEKNKWYDREFHEIPNPVLTETLTTDPATGWKVMHDGDVTYYYDEQNIRYYTLDRRLLYTHPDGYLCYLGDDSKWYRLTDKAECTSPLPKDNATTDVKNSNWLIVRDDSEEALYYYDKSTTKWYDMVNRLEIPSPLYTDGRIMTTPIDGLRMVRDGNGYFIYFYDLENYKKNKTDIFYDTNRKRISNPIQSDARIHLDPATGWQIIRKKNGTFNCFFNSSWEITDASKGTWGWKERYYNISRKEISKPDLTQ